MTSISDAQIASYAKAVGLNAGQTAIAVAIALAESGGNPTAHNSVPPDDSYGLWQINMLGSMGPSRRQQFDITSNDQLFDPMVNARAMKYLSNGGQNWRPWTTYTRGTYLRFMARGQAASGAAPAVPGATPVSLGSDSLSGLTGVLTMFSTPGMWVRMGLLTLGMGVLIYGLFKVTGDNAIGQGTKGVAKAAIGLIPGGGTVTQVVKGAARMTK